MKRPVIIGIAVVILSARLWKKLFIVSDVVGKMPMGSYLTQENMTWGLATFVAIYYIAIKVFM